MNQTFQKISDDISNRLDCNRFGNCIHFAELFTEKVGMTDTDLLDDFFVIEGYVKIGSEVLEHTWIETKEGVKIDPTNQQFGDFKYSSKIVNKWTGLEYYMVMRKDLTWRKEREEYPKKVFKHIKEYNKFLVPYGSKGWNKGSEYAQKIVDFLCKIRLGDERDIDIFGDFNDYNFVISNRYKIYGFFEGSNHNDPKDWSVLIVDTHDPDWEMGSQDYSVKLLSFNEDQLKEIYEKLPKYINYTQDVVFKIINNS